MKFALKVSTLLAVLLIAVIPAWGRRVPGDKVEAAVDAIVYDFGTVHESNGPVTHNFQITNKGTSALAIIWVKPKCGCTASDYPRKPLMPGEKADIKVVFYPEGQRGEVDKEVRVRLKNGKGTSEEISLRMAGVVVP